MRSRVGKSATPTWAEAVRKERKMDRVIGVVAALAVAGIALRWTTDLPIPEWLLTVLTGMLIGMAMRSFYWHGVHVGITYGQHHERESTAAARVRADG